MKNAEGFKFMKAEDGKINKSSESYRKQHNPNNLNNNGAQGFIRKDKPSPWAKMGAEHNEKERVYRAKAPSHI
jgi:hypothetical protein